MSKVTIAYHIYECRDCVVNFAVEQTFEEQDVVKCPVCSEQNIEVVGYGSMEVIPEMEDGE